MKGQLDPSAEGCRIITQFVQTGGMYMGSCAGAFDAALVSDSFLAVCPQQRHLQLVNAAIWNRNDTEWIGLNSPGVGVLESRNLRPDHPVMFGLPERFRITHYNGPLFEPQPGAVAHASDPIGLSAVAGFTEDFTPAEYFLHFSEFDHAAAERSSLIGQAARRRSLQYRRGVQWHGRVVLFGSHPEFGYNWRWIAGTFRSDAGKRRVLAVGLTCRAAHDGAQRWGRLIRSCSAAVCGCGRETGRDYRRGGRTEPARRQRSGLDGR
jgi:hypothetical protein